MQMRKSEFDAWKVARKAAFAKASKSGVRKSSGDTEITDMKTNYSLVKLIKGHHFGDWENAENEKRHYQKALNTRVGSEGAFLVPHVVSTELIERLKAQTVLDKLPGVRFVPMESKSLSFGREDTGVTVTWGSEGDTMSSDTTKTFGEVELDLKQATCLYPMQRQLLKYATASVEDIVKQDMVDAMAVARDLAMLEGTGGLQPLGMYYNPRIRNTDLSGTASWDSIFDMMYNIELGNSETTAWVSHPRTKNVYRQFKDANGRYLYDDTAPKGGGVQVPTLGGTPCYYTTTVPITNRPGNAESYIVGGKWSDLMVGESGELLIETSTQADTAFATHQLWVKMVAEVDFAIRHSESFGRIAGVQ